VKNLVQLARTLGREAGATDRLRFLHAYLGDGATRADRRTWTRGVARRGARKDRSKPAPVAGATRPRVSCTVVCQNEERNLGLCLESVGWCDEIVIVDGGSHDRTLDVA